MNGGRPHEEAGVERFEATMGNMWLRRGQHVSLYSKRNIEVMNGGGGILAFLSQGQKGFEKKESRCYNIIIRNAFSQLVKGNKFIPT